MLKQLHQALRRGRATVEYAECKRCGSAVDDGRPCSDCGSREIARYTF